LEPMSAIEFEMIGTCIHNVSYIHLCPKCEIIWMEEIGKEEEDGFCKSIEEDDERCSEEVG